jgi:hypothetical protein
MRRSILALIGAAALLASCGPQTKQGQGQDQGAAPAPAVGAEEPALPADEAWVLPDQVVLASAAGGSDGPKITVGTKVKILETAAPSVRVAAPDGATGWVPSAALAIGVRRGVLVRDAEGWSKLTFVGYAPIDGDSAHVTATSASETGDARTATLEKTALSFNRDDIALAAQWRQASAENDAAARADRLNKALVKFPSSQFAGQVQEVIEALVGKSDVAAEDFSQIATVDSAGADVLSAPQGKVVEHLSGGEQVQTVERTKASEGSGADARWYKLADPAGWVAGTSLKF